MSSLAAVLAGTSLALGSDRYAAQAGNWSFGLGGLPAFGLSLDPDTLNLFAVHLAVSERASGKHPLH